MSALSGQLFMHGEKMPSSSLTKTITDLLEKAVSEQVFPGAVAAVSYGAPKERKKVIVAKGVMEKLVPPAKMDNTVFFDLASLTKSFATLPALLCLKKSRQLDLTESLPSLLQINVPTALQHITIPQLLGHSSGLAAHRPFYEKLRGFPLRDRKQLLHKWLLQEELQYAPGSKTLYSDLGYMFLSWIVEVQSGLPFHKYVEEMVLAPLDLTEHLFFNPLWSIKKRVYAPTEKCSWRHKTLRGEVHDDNCYAVCGVSGHAGLFGDIEGVLALAQHFLDVRNGRIQHPNYRASDLQMVTKRQNIATTSWALGFDTPSSSGSSAGAYMSDESFGHLGFTGTSCWIDPQKDLTMILLTNRVHPSRNNERIRQFRPLFHNAINKWLATQ